MITSYEVGAVFRLVDEASPALRQLSERLTSLDRLIGTVQKSLSQVGAFKASALLAGVTDIEDKLGGLSGKALEAANGITRSFQTTDAAITGTGSKIVGLGNSFGTLDEKASAAVTAMNGSFGRADASIGTTTAAVDRLATRLQEAGSSARSLGSIPRLGGGGGGGHTRPGPGNTGGHGGGSRHGAGADLGIFGFMGFEAAKTGVEDVLKHGMEITHVQEQMRQGGMSMDEIAQATAAARNEAEKYGLSITKVMEDIKEIRFPFGSTEHAIGFIDPLERMRVVLNSVSEGKGNESADSVYKMARAGELKGLVDPEQYLSYFENMTKVISATGGKVGPNDFMQATKFSKLAGFGMDEDFYTKYLPTMIQTMGASTAGQSMMSLFNTLVSGSVTKRALGNMNELGLVGDTSKIRYDKQGNPVGFSPGAIQGTDELVRDPLKWAKDVLTPLLEKKYGDLGVDENKQRAIEGLGGLFGNRNSAAAVAELALRTKSFDRDAALTGKASGLGGVEQLLAHDPTASINNFSAAWTNLLASLGKPAVQMAVESLNGMARGLNVIGEAAAAHPDVARSLVGIGAGLAGALGTLALVGIAAFIPGGAVVVGLTTLAGALVGLAAANADKLGLSFENFSAHFHKMASDWEGQNARVNQMLSDIASLGSKLADAILGLWHGLVAKLRAIPGVSALLGDDVSGIMGRPAHPHTATPMTGGAAQQYLQGLGMLPNTTGLPLGFNPIAFSNDNGVSSIAQGVFQGLTMYANGGGAAGIGAAGGGLVNAAYTTYGSGGTADGARARAGAGLPGLSAGGASIPGHIGGTLTIGGDSFRFGSGGVRGAASIPLGDYPITPGAIGAWGQAHGAIGINGNRIWDETLGRARLGIEMHAGHSAALITEGCLAFVAKEFPRLKDKIATMIHDHGAAYLHVGPHGATITPYRGGDAPLVTAPPRKVTPGAPASGMEAMNLPPIHVHTTHVLDGKVIGKSVTKHFASAGRFPTAMGGPDPHSHYVSPGTPVTDAA